MDAVTLLNEHIDIEKLLHHYNFDRVTNNGGMIRACCKIHDGNDPSSFVANQETNLWYCHSNCGGGDAYTLVQHMEECDFYTAVRWIADFFGVDIKNLRITERKIEYIQELKNWMNVMRGKKKKDFQLYQIKEEIREVTKFRNFDANTLRHFGLGYVEKVSLNKRNGDEYTLEHRLTFPIIFGGLQIGISFRRLRNRDYPKWSHQPVHLQTRDILYNYDSVINQPRIVITEGITDVWAFHEINVPAVATFGAHITKEQYKLLLKTGADLIFAFDGDDAGQKAFKKAIEMFKYKANVEHVEFDEGEDPESISREVLKEKYEQRKRIC